MSPELGRGEPTARPVRGHSVLQASVLRPPPVVEAGAEAAAPHLTTTGTAAWTRSCSGTEAAAARVWTEVKVPSEASRGARETASEASTGRPASGGEDSLTGTSLETRTATGSVRGQ